MAVTLLADIITQVRAAIVEPTPKFWTNPELLDILKLGALDLYGAILDLHQAHYHKISTSAILKATSDQITGVPDDCFRVLLIEPLDTTSQGAGRGMMFTPRKYNDASFIVARTQSAVDPGGLPSQIFYDISGLGPPIKAPTILTAPQLSQDLPLRIVYNPNLDIQDYNPIPGNSDNALKAWTIAYALGKEQSEMGDKAPNSGWLAVYAAERQAILTRLTPRQEQEPEVVEDVFQGYGSNW